MVKNGSKWRKYAFEFLSIFIAVISAFALNNWQENRRDHRSEIKILAEIKNGLVKDIEDMELNARGHEFGLETCDYFKNFVSGTTVILDSFPINYFMLTRDFNSIQNISGYESLKSKGLEIIQNDSLRQKIISFYEYEMAILKNLEEEYPEMQFHDSYFKDINQILLPAIEIDSIGRIQLNPDYKFPYPKQKELRILLWKIKNNRAFILGFYQKAVKKIQGIIDEINIELEKG